MTRSGDGRRQAAPARLPTSSASRLKLLILLPLTMTLLVAATGFFATSMARRISLMHGATGAEATRLFDQLTMQLSLVSVIAGVLGAGLAIGVTTPLRTLGAKLEAVAAGDLRASFDARSAPEAEWLAGAFNDAIAAVNRYLVRSMTGAVITLSPDGRIVGSSPAAEMLLGYREEEIKGRRLSDVLAPAGGSRAGLAAIESAIARRQAVAADEADIATKDGRRIRVALSVSYLRRTDTTPGAPGGEPDELVALTIGFRDVDEIRRLREHLQKADQLVALGTLTAGVAHELRNPLASLRGLTELLGRDFEEADPRRRYVSTMLEAIDRLNKLVEDLLQLSTEAPAEAGPVEIDRLVEDVATFTRHGMGDRRVTLALDREGLGPALVRGARHRLEQALSNIVLNAVQATPDGGTVTVRVRSGDGRVSVRVHNTGSFIPPELKKQLFVPFYTTKPTGTGLGLAIARQVVTAAGGSIDVESDPQGGTAFTIELPAAEGAGGQG